ncbi:MAG: hypothetical protein ABI645_01035, partial [Pseudomonadota bacterium]
PGSGHLQVIDGPKKAGRSGAVAAKLEVVQKKLGDIERDLKQASLESDAANSVLTQSHNFENWRSLASSVRDQLDRTNQDLQPASTHLETLTLELAKARDEQTSSSAKYSELASESANLTRLISSMEATLIHLARVPTNQIAALEHQRSRIDASLALLRKDIALASVELNTATADEAAAQAKLQEYSESDAKFVTATNELRAAITDENCTLCGHHHGSRGELEQAIESVVSRRLSASEHLSSSYEASVTKRRHAEEATQRLKEAIAVTEREYSEISRTLEQRQLDRASVITTARDLVAGFGLRIEVSEQVLQSLLPTLRKQIAEAGPIIEFSKSQMEEAIQRRSDLENELSARRASVDQMRRLKSDIELRIASHEHEKPVEIADAQVFDAQVLAQSAERRILQAQHIEGGLRVEVGQLERSLNDLLSRKAGATSRLQTADLLLATLDSELAAIGATRSVESILAIETATRLERDRVETLGKRAHAIREGFVRAEREKAKADAEGQLQSARSRLENLQSHQEFLSRRAAQLSALRQTLQDAQNAMSETVLKSIQNPVGILFKAMTAGCAWDIDLSLDDGGRIQAQVSDEFHSDVPATSLLNSAFYNVAAVALRIALAGQQSWSNLRTVVLDDPILEMDLLTQSSLLDGLDAVLSAGVSPWEGLQLVITTWSEDFAVLAAHKLAHLNRPDATVPDDFYIYRLSTSPSGEPKAERHTPRWDKAVSAA